MAVMVALVMMTISLLEVIRMTGAISGITTNVITMYSTKPAVEV